MGRDPFFGPRRNTGAGEGGTICTFYGNNSGPRLRQFPRPVGVLWQTPFSASALSHWDFARSPLLHLSCSSDWPRQRIERAGRWPQQPAFPRPPRLLGPLRRSAESKGAARDAAPYREKILENEIGMKCLAPVTIILKVFHTQCGFRKTTVFRTAEPRLVGPHQGGHPNKSHAMLARSAMNDTATMLVKAISTPSIRSECSRIAPSGNKGSML
jgi:hypothetical protein